MEGTEPRSLPVQYWTGKLLDSASACANLTHQSNTVKDWPCYQCLLYLFSLLPCPCPLACPLWLNVIWTSHFAIIMSSLRSEPGYCCPLYGLLSPARLVLSLAAPNPHYLTYQTLTPPTSQSLAHTIREPGKQPNGTPSRHIGTTPASPWSIVERWKMWSHWCHSKTSHGPQSLYGWFRSSQHMGKLIVHIRLLHSIYAKWTVS